MSPRPRLCLCLSSATLAGDLRVLEECRGCIDMVELRADFLAPGEVARAAELPRLAGVPAILTVRRARDGGAWTGSEADRVSVLERLLAGGFAFVDLEEDLEAPGPVARAARAGTRVIRSLHDFDGVPADLAGRVRRLPRSAGELPKAAVMTRGTADLVRLLRAARNLEGTEKIILGMGEAGFPTRVLAARLGSAVCYSSATGAAAAPGHADPRTLDRLYRMRAIGPATRLFGVVGNPVAHSLSPLIHNRAFAAAGIDAVYVPFLVDDLASFLEAADLLGVEGISITVPWKQEVLPVLAARDTLVDAVGACNTAVRRPADDGGAGGWQGTNTDVEGFLGPRRAAFGGEVPRGLRATVIGAGGASRAVLHALSGLGAEVLLLNRTPGRARELAARFPVTLAGLDAEGASLARQHADLLVQATSAGMEPDLHADPFSAYRFSGSEVVYELVYAPRRTAFLARAEAAGCRTVPGIEMLVAQARLQFRAFTGQEMPPGDFLQA